MTKHPLADAVKNTRSALYGIARGFTQIFLDNPAGVCDTKKVLCNRRKEREICCLK